MIGKLVAIAAQDVAADKSLLSDLPTLVTVEISCSLFKSPPSSMVNVRECYQEKRVSAKKHEWYTNIMSRYHDISVQGDLRPYMPAELECF